MENFSPAISVIVPVYNAEKYLPACLESILAQTFTDFELLVVDDCSTDRSLTIAESFRVRDGRLKIISLPENTGNPSIPRNVGLENSRGKYVLFVDNDDLLTQNALKTFCDAAKNFRADVVYTQRGYLCDGFGNVTVAALDKNLAPVESPTLESDDIGERVEKFLRTCYGWAPWAKFLRRDLLITNKIFFPCVKISEDVLWSFKVICAAKNFLRVPNPLYVHRNNGLSVSNSAKSPQQTVKLWISPLITVSERLEQFMNTLEFFKKNPNARLRMHMYFVKLSFINIKNALKSLKPAEVYEIIVREFSEAGSSQPALISCLIIMTNIYKQTLEERIAHD